MSKFIKLAVRGFCALAESEADVTPAAMYSWPKIKEALEHSSNQGKAVLAELAQLTEAARDRVLDYVAGFAPLSPQGETYAFADAARAKTFAMHAAENYGSRVESFDAQVVNVRNVAAEFLDPSALKLGGVKRENALHEDFGHVDDALPGDMLNAGLPVFLIEKSLLAAVEKRLAMEEAVISTQGPEQKFAGRLARFFAPQRESKKVAGVDRKLVEALVIKKMIPADVLRRLNEEDSVGGGGTATATPDKSQDSGISRDQPDVSNGQPAGSQNGTKAEPKAPTEHVPTQEQGSPTGITMPDGTPIPEEVLRGALSKLLQNLSTQVSQNTVGGKPGEPKGDGEDEAKPGDPEADPEKKKDAAAAPDKPAATSPGQAPPAAPAAAEKPSAPAAQTEGKLTEARAKPGDVVSWNTMLWNVYDVDQQHGFAVLLPNKSQSTAADVRFGKATAPINQVKVVAEGKLVENMAPKAGDRVTDYAGNPWIVIATSYSYDALQRYDMSGVAFSGDSEDAGRLLAAVRDEHGETAVYVVGDDGVMESRKRRAPDYASAAKALLEGKLDLGKFLTESAPPGGEPVVRALKRNPDVDNAYAIAWSMKNKGFIESLKCESAPSGELVMTVVDEGAFLPLTLRPIRLAAGVVARVGSLKEGGSDRRRVQRLTFAAGKFTEATARAWALQNLPGPTPSRREGLAEGMSPADFVRGLSRGHWGFFADTEVAKLLANDMATAIEAQDDENVLKALKIDWNQINAALLALIRGEPALDQVCAAIIQRALGRLGLRESAVAKLLTETLKVGDPVLIVGGPSDVRGKTGRIGEIRRPMGGAPRYTVDYDVAPGRRASVSLGGSDIRGVKPDGDDRNLTGFYEAAEKPSVAGEKDEKAIAAQAIEDAEVLMRALKGAAFDLVTSELVRLEALATAMDNKKAAKMAEKFRTELEEMHDEIKSALEDFDKLSAALKSGLGKDAAVPAPEAAAPAPAPAPPAVPPPAETPAPPPPAPAEAAPAAAPAPSANEVAVAEAVAAIVKTRIPERIKRGAHYRELAEAVQGELPHLDVRQVAEVIDRIQRMEKRAGERCFRMEIAEGDRSLLASVSASAHDVAANLVSRASHGPTVVLESELRAAVTALRTYGGEVGHRLLADEFCRSLAAAPPAAVAK